MEQINTKKPTINRILIANRGEIAVRIIKTARQMGIETVAIYTAAEKYARHVENADIKVLLKGSTIDQSYLNAAQIVDVALRNQVDAIHPGYGFLSENNDFAQRCANNGIVFIGPSPAQIKMMGNKDEANKIAEICKIPLLKKVKGTVQQILEKAETLNLPIVIKAAAGGGGKGMRVVNDFKNLETELNVAAAEALRYFGNASVYIEEYVQNTRHIEVQVLADTHGKLIHLHERECSIQRRHQKVIEEAPAPNLSVTVKNNIINDALLLARHIGYTNAGTVEFLLTPNGKHYFLEMNTRIQVEHPVTEEITGVDIVREQIRIANGWPLSISQQDITVTGHAIEARIYAEDPGNNFIPSFGSIIDTYMPKHPHIRIDAGAHPQEELSPNFDSLLTKVIAKGKNRAEAIDRLNVFLRDYALFGIKTNREIIMEALNDPDFNAGNYSTSFFKTKKKALLKQKSIDNNCINILSAAFVALKNYRKNPGNDVWNQLGYWRSWHHYQLFIQGKSVRVDLKNVFSDSFVIVVDNQQNCTVSHVNIEARKLTFLVDNELFEVCYAVSKAGICYIQYDGLQVQVTDIPENNQKKMESDNLDAIRTIMAPMPGLIVDVMVQEGEQIKKGNPLLVLEAMKTENIIHAFKDTTITRVSVAKGQQVSLNQLLMETE
ncbi:3-methylcrotonyl-CoA carboxylase alpha subunit/acetyl-CoA/propionyl-CoA carboxylase, biotin carboxylase, biotin carboxyl carrier protein/geranyl-CoA carboxylase alpha subunit [Saccharicrinis carchari]|uniref:3-methylcrotonyl-CoA carboxylase alpha subunit/acetyl-CoA/propionyl-CoA carboxylase, biotin carboxylase, biotin carboxyl carrier protein/geranyl-CoA carboxylase alpha subunit n=1 Tax=Saccharicrinis carchari TaxID=1168039 RepID=A0A521AGQ3_SACCC|nr:biotin carboxylase N-terminal domain-containing protein [Saccharicrinis carchari]SMO34015.1 3-methylcrotonyl-CoA carboxylase alpha subunit/acetyl-CoA/propionyl-CoA carboxylase, biotin carboxylase, biotin carboxyl carrier protein/geranyl-CoA carboxylase alpha subunit [Saccharicrinis carchari]